MTTWEDEGFLSGEARRYVELAHQRFGESFRLARDFVGYIHRLRFAVPKTSEELDEARFLLVIGLFGRALSTYESVILLCSVGMISEARVLQRKLVEILFKVGALKRRPNVAAVMLGAERRAKQVALRKAIAMDFAKTVPGAIEEMSKALTNIDSEIEQEGKAVAKVQQYAEWSGYSQPWYDVDYRLFSVEAHAEPGDLLNVTGSNAKQRQLWANLRPLEPDLDTTEALIGRATDAIIFVTEDAAVVFRSGLAGEWKELKARVRRLHDARLGRQASAE